MLYKAITIQMSTYSKVYNQYQKWLTENTVFAVHTTEAYLRIIKNFILYLEGSNLMRLNDVDKDIVVRFSHFNSSKKRYAPASINLRLAALNCFFSWTYEKEYSRENPLINYKRSKIVPKPLSTTEKGKNNSTSVILLPFEQEQLIKHGIDDSFVAVRNKCIVLTILASALFIEEVIDLTPEFLDLKRGYIDIAGEDKRERRISIDLAICQEACQAWLAIRKKALADIKLPYLFFTEQLQPLTRRRLYKIVSDYVLEAGIQSKRSGPEVLRLTAICNMLEKYSIQDVQLYSGLKTLNQLGKYQQLITLIV